MTKEVFYDKYCSTCVSRDIDEFEDPCDTCLEYPSNDDSHKPINYKKKED